MHRNPGKLFSSRIQTDTEAFFAEQNVDFNDWLLKITAHWRENMFESTINLLDNQLSMRNASRRGILINGIVVGIHMTEEVCKRAHKQEGKTHVLCHQSVRA